MESPQVVEHEMLLVCTTVGWGPKLPEEGFAKLPECQPNVCPNLLEKKIKQGTWECIEHSNNNSCKNHRTGEICALKCQEHYKVQTQTLKDFLKITYLGIPWPYQYLYRNRLAAKSRTAQMLWVGKTKHIFKIENVLSCPVPENPKNGQWNCGVIKSGTTVCLLECKEKFAAKGSPIIECDLKQGKFDPDPKESLCQGASNIEFQC